MAFWSAAATPSSPTTATTMSLCSFSTPSVSFRHYQLNFRTCNKLNRTNTRNGFPISCCSNSATSSSSSVSEASIMATTMINPPVIKKRKRYRKEYPGESVGITEEMRFVAMRLRNIKGKYINKTGNDPIDFDEEDGEKSDGVDEESSIVGEDGDDGGGTWEPSVQGFVKYLVDSKLVFDTVERIVDESEDVSYAYFRITGLERSEGLLKDLEWFSMQNVEIPEPSNAGVSYVKYLEELAEKSAPLFLSHFYNIYFSHIAGGQVIAKQVSKTLLGGRELEFYSWEGDVQELLKDVRDKLNMLGEVQKAIVGDEIWCKWLEDCANGKIPGCNDFKIQSYARATLLNKFCNDGINKTVTNDNDQDTGSAKKNRICPRYNDMIFLINPEMPHWKCPEEIDSEIVRTKPDHDDKSSSTDVDSLNSEGRVAITDSDDSSMSASVEVSTHCSKSEVPLLDIVFVHGLRGGPYKTWRIAEDKSSTKSGLVEKIDQEAGKQGTFWPREWLSADFPQAHLFTLKYKTNLTQWSGASLPLQEVSSMLLEKLVAAGIGDGPVVFVTHRWSIAARILVADLQIGELRSGSPRFVELNDFVHHLRKKGLLDVLSFCKTKVTPIVEGYGGWVFRMEIVPIESAYPGFGELVVLESTDHINSCKPVSRTDPSYKETLRVLAKTESPAFMKRGSTWNTCIVISSLQNCRVVLDSGGCICTELLTSYCHSSAQSTY